jgi:hypothetical protein
MTRTPFPGKRNLRTRVERNTVILIGLENKKQKHSEEYAIVQKFYRKKIKSCFNRILDSGVDYTCPSTVEFDGY